MAGSHGSSVRILIQLPMVMDPPVGNNAHCKCWHFLVKGLIRVLKQAPCSETCTTTQNTHGPGASNSSVELPFLNQLYV